MKKVAREAVKRYVRFHGKRPSKVTTVDFPQPKALVLLGRGKAVEYISDKAFNGRKANLFRHILGKKVKVYCDPKGRWLFISGGRFRVSDWLRG